MERIVMKKILLILSCISLSFTACSTDDTTGVTDSLDLNALRVGQESILILYKSSCNQFPEVINFTGDSLRWKVKSRLGNIFLVEEAFTAGSPLYNLEPVQYSIIDYQDYVLVPDRFSSNLFFFYGNDTIYKSPTPTLNLEQDACNFVDSSNAIFTGDAIAHVVQAEIGERSLSNQILVSCVPIKLNLNGYILYSEGKIESIHSYDTDAIAVRGWMPL